LDSEHTGNVLGIDIRESGVSWVYPKIIAKCVEYYISNNNKSEDDAKKQKRKVLRHLIGYQYNNRNKRPQIVNRRNKELQYNSTFHMYGRLKKTNCLLPKIHT